MVARWDQQESHSPHHLVDHLAGKILRPRPSNFLALQPTASEPTWKNHNVRWRYRGCRRTTFLIPRNDHQLYLKHWATGNRTPLSTRDDASLFSSDRPRTERPPPFIPRYFSNSDHSPPSCTPRGRSHVDRHPLMPPPQSQVEARPDPDLHGLVTPDSPYIRP